MSREHFLVKDPMNEEGSSSALSIKKMRFKPNKNAAGAYRCADIKKEVNRDMDLLAQDNNSTTRELIQRIDENRSKRGPKLTKKLPVQVGFGQGAPLNTIRTFGRGDSSNTGSKLELPGPDDYNPLAVVPLDEPRKKNKDYVDPWSYHTNYPTIHPLREPSSVDPEILNEEEFGKALTLVDGEEHINSAAELELLDESEEPELIFLQLPESLPLPIVKREPSAKGKEVVNSSERSKTMMLTERRSHLNVLAKGSMGKMLVYKSGAVKMKLGSVLYDVSPGTDCYFAQELAVGSAKEKKLGCIGDLYKRATVTPDFNQMLDK